MTYNRKTLLSVSNIPKSEIGNIDDDMIPILIELNSKGYKTLYCCGGHTNKDGKWHSYISFKKMYDFSIGVPIKYNLVTVGSSFFWDGNSEEERLEWLCKALEWAKSLPKREEIPQYYYEIKGGNLKQKGTYNKDKIITDGRKNYVVTRRLVGFK